MLSSNKLKIIAAISMLIDHIGYMFFPDILIFRIIGRLAF
ncbi:MAG: conjugal transfer protein TraX, partial [Clostridia bacterium]|nr:conjugal transfer protein TraX [Clostridia bacterium]